MAATRQKRNSGSTNRTVVEHSGLFAGGLNTEVSDTVDAVPYTSDECNCDIRNNGTRSRRLGIDYERDFELLNYASEEGENTDKWAFNVTEWVDVKDRPGEHYIVVQTGLKLFFYKNEGAPYSKKIELAENTQSPYFIDVTRYVLEDYRHLLEGETEYKVDDDGKPNWTVDEKCKREPLRFTEAYGSLFVCGKYITPFVLRGLTPPEISSSSSTTQSTAVLDIRSHWNNEEPRQYYTERTFQLGDSTPYTSSAFLCYRHEGTTFKSLWGYDKSNRGDYLKQYKMIGGLIGAYAKDGSYLGWLEYDHRFFKWDNDGSNDYSYGSFKVMRGKPVEYTEEYIGSGGMHTTYYRTRVETYVDSWNTSEEGLEIHHFAPIDDFGEKTPEYTYLFPIRVPTANYYSRLWNALPYKINRGVTSSPNTPFKEDLTYENEEPSGTPESLVFKSSAGEVEGKKITMKEVFKTKRVYARWFGSNIKSATFKGLFRYTKATGLSLKVRDFEGVLDVQDYVIDGETTKDVDFRMSSTVALCPQQDTPEHRYNLYNQGWTSDQIEAFYKDSEASAAIGYKGYPANNMQWFVAKKGFDSNSDSIRTFKPAELCNTYFGGTIAPRGHFILDYFKQNREDVSILKLSEAALKEASRPSQQYVTDIIAYAGRVFYLVGETVLYSQVILEDFSKADKCYQEADPTSETISDILDTDGGMIKLPEIGTGVRFCIIGGALGVVGNRATALLGGGSENIFTATAYTATTLMTVGSSSPDSFVSTEEGLFYWATTGVAQLKIDGGTAVYDIISKNSIQTLYDNIPERCVRACKAVYDKPSKQIIWMYPDEDNLNRLVNMLKLNIQTGQWTRYRLIDERMIGSRLGDEKDDKDSPAPHVCAAISLEEPYRSQNEYYLYAQEDTSYFPITNNEGQYIIAEEPLQTEKVLYSSVLYLINDTINSSITFGNFNNNNFQDWAKADLSGDGYDYESYLVSHPILLGLQYQNKTSPYLLATFRRTEKAFDLTGAGIHPSACQGSVLWDWSENGDSGKWDAQQELYRYDKESLLDAKMVSSKTRVYGSGRALQVRLSSVNNKGFIVENVGFQLYVDGRI